MHFEELSGSAFSHCLLRCVSPGNQQDLFDFLDEQRVHWKDAVLVQKSDIVDRVVRKQYQFDPCVGMNVFAVFRLGLLDNSVLDRELMWQMDST